MSSSVLRAVVKSAEKWSAILVSGRRRAYPGAWKMKPSNCISPGRLRIRPSLESGVGKIADTVGALRKPTCGVEVGTDLPVFRFKVEPVGAEVQSAPRLVCPV